MGGERAERGLILQHCILDALVSWVVSAKCRFSRVFEMIGEPYGWKYKRHRKEFETKRPSRPKCPWRRDRAAKEAVERDCLCMGGIWRWRPRVGGGPGTAGSPTSASICRCPKPSHLMGGTRADCKRFPGAGWTVNTPTGNSALLPGNCSFFGTESS